MRWIKRLLVLLIILAVFAFALFFTVQNTATVPLDLIWLQLEAQPISQWLLASFCVGALFGFLFNLWALAKLKARQMGLQRDLAKQTNGQDRAA